MNREQASSQENGAGGARPPRWESSAKPHQIALLAAMAEGDFLDLAINAMRDLFLVLDLDGAMVGYNEYTKTLTGYSDEELKMKPLGVYCPEEEAPKIKEAFRLSLEGDVSKIETWVVCRDGSQIPIEYWSTPLRDREGGVIGAIVIGRDLTERKQAEEALKEREAHFRALIENSSDIIEIIDPDNRIVYMSPSVQRILGYRPEEMIGRPGLDFNHPDEFEMITATVKEIVGTGTPCSATFRCRHKDGSWRVFEAIGSLLPGRTEDHLIVNIRDITERAVMESALADANRELEIFARAVTHDIMAPLSAISIVGESLERLVESGDSNRNTLMAREMVDTIRCGVADAIGLATDIVSLSQVQAPEGVVDRVDAGRVVKRVVEQLCPEIMSRGVDMKVDEPLGEILANPTHIYQVFLNLISNAVKYNNDRHPVVTVSRLESPAEDAHRFLVRDNGPGVAQETIDLLFEPFFKGESGGTGLGLATVMKVVKLYAGTVAVYNDGGACFEFTLYDAKQGVDQG